MDMTASEVSASIPFGFDLGEGDSSFTHSLTPSDSAPSEDDSAKVGG